MKNSTLVAQYLDYCAEIARLSDGKTPDDVQEASERILSGHSQLLFEACLDDGWTVAEINAAYARRFKKQW
jgi:hypothetical protein